MIRAILLLAALAAPVAAQLPAPQTAAPQVAPAEDWRAIARQDVLGGYTLYSDNHPGMHDPGNPGFPAQLARARDSALALADRAASYEDYADVLGAFSAGLADGHAQMVAIPPTEGIDAREWPGFIAAWRGEGLFVHHAGPGSPAPAGAAILSCDGRAAADFVRDRLGRRGLRPDEGGQWWARSPQAFLSNALMRRGRPESCRFRTADGAERDLALAWSPAPEDYDARVRTAREGERTAIGLTEPRLGLFLIGLPDFQPDAEGVAAYRALDEALRARRPDLLRARAIVLDLRRNNGGSSQWSLDVAKRLWGDASVAGTMGAYFRDVAIWWRASAGNVGYMADMERRIRESGHESVADQMHAVGLGMRAALEHGEPYFVERDSEGPPPAGPVPPSDLTVPVYVITPGGCASACLDAVDTFTRFSNTRLIGAPTSADSIYMEVRVTPLPSGRGRIVIPNKMWKGRPRASGEVYAPRILVTDLDWSTAVFLDRIESDLAQTRR